MRRRTILLSSFLFTVTLGVVVALGGVAPEWCRAVSFLDSLGYFTVPDAIAQVGGGCKCKGVVFDGATQCCAGGVVRPMEMDDISLYPAKFRRPDYIPFVTQPACGAEGGVAGLDNVFGAEFDVCCAKHDLDWQDCFGNRAQSDKLLGKCLKGKCAGIQNKADRSTCNSLANIFTLAVKSPFGTANYSASIKQACVGCIPRTSNCWPERWTGDAGAIQRLRDFWMCITVNGCFPQWLCEDMGVCDYDLGIFPVGDDDGGGWWFDWWWTS